MWKQHSIILTLSLQNAECAEVRAHGVCVCVCVCKLQSSLSSWLILSHVRSFVGLLPSFQPAMPQRNAPCLSLSLSKVLQTSAGKKIDLFFELEKCTATRHDELNGVNKFQELLARKAVCFRWFTGCPFVYPLCW